MMGTMTMTNCSINGNTATMVRARLWLPLRCGALPSPASALLRKRTLAILVRGAGVGCGAKRGGKGVERGGGGSGRVDSGG